MLCLISPAKLLNTTQIAPIEQYTQPAYLKQSRQLVKILRQLTPLQMARLLRISDQLAGLNVARYAQWSTPFQLSQQDPVTKQAVFMFAGEVYRGLKAEQFSLIQLQQLQKQLRILSGLYGLLRPLDLIQPYRLEMATPIINPKGNNLYVYWQSLISRDLSQAIDQNGGEAILINLASNEYFKVINKNYLTQPIITVEFKQYKNGQLKTIVPYTKNARGRMVRWIIENNIAYANELKSFDVDGYYFNKQLSSNNCWIFVRKQS